MDLEMWHCSYPFLNTHSRQQEYTWHIHLILSSQLHRLGTMAQIAILSQHATTDKSEANSGHQQHSLPSPVLLFYSCLNSHPSYMTDYSIFFSFFYILLSYKNTAHFLILQYFLFLWHYTWRIKLGCAA